MGFICVSDRGPSKRQVINDVLSYANDELLMSV